MADWDNLKLEQMAVDTTLAQKYFDTKGKVFTSSYDGNPIKYTNTSVYTLDQSNNKIYCIDKKEFDNHYKHFKFETDSSRWADLLGQLAEEIQKNRELFCQLVHVLKNYAVDDVKKDVQLLINKCLHTKSLLGKYGRRKYLCMGAYQSLYIAGPPLYYLSCAVSEIALEKSVIIHAHPQAAAICTLFVELCAKVGLEKFISLHLMRAEDMPSDIGIVAEGCIGVVNETADLDSAVHAFVSSTTQYPWRLNKLLIQESVYEEFQMALQWKCNVNVSDKGLHEPHLKQLSTDTQVADGKIFLIDYVGTGNVESKLHPVVVSAYRTNKELLSIMSKYEEPFVSLWCTDSAHANEIAFSISSSCVWINSYAVFNGSPRVSNAVPLETSKIIKRCLEKMIKDYEQLEKIQTAWLKLDLEKRRDVTLEALRRYIANTTDDTKDIAVRVQTLLTTQTPGFIEVNKNDMWICIESPVGLVCVDEYDNNDFIVDAIASIVYGNRVVLDIGLERYKSLVKELEKAGLPIIGAQHSISYIRDRCSLYATRAVYSNFGTIFAN